MFDPLHDIDWSRTAPMEPFAMERPAEFEQRQVLATQAKNFLATFNQCRGVVRMRWGEGCAPCLGVFLCEIEIGPEEPLERYVWVVVGDTAPMVVSTKQCRNVYQALAQYNDRCQTWISQHRDHPDDAKRNLAELLSRRVELIERDYIEPNRWLLTAPTAHDRMSSSS